ncbi:MAG TPA: hypothetical protein VFF65_01785, partial [Phycisphaerales bacterium]|nr:hypothetical protein [Phycisphaerales bacterium]
VATSAGHVGVGTANPIRGLHVSGANDTGAEFILENRGLAPDNRKLNLWGDTAGGAGRFYLRLINDAATAVTREFLAFDNATGNVGVGTTAPEERLHVNGKVKATGLCLGEVCKGSWSEVGGSQWANGASGAITYGSGNVGIGTASPGTLLHLAAPSSGPQMRFGVDANTSLMQFWKDSPVTRTASIGLQSPGGGLSDDLIFSTYTNATGAWSPRLTIKNGGNVGIGTGAADPGAKLEVNAGSAEAVAIKATGTIMADNIVAKFQDVAEWVPSVQKLSPGTVVILDAGRVNHVLASSSAYDTKVAGVVSAQPGVILGVGGEGKVMVATTGRVKVRADASRGAIRVGDLLVTSGVEGVAMKSVPVELGGTQIHRPGTIIGKALEPLEKGVGEILVLLSLQ